MLGLCEKNRGWQKPEPIRPRLVESKGVPTAAAHIGMFIKVFGLRDGLISLKTREKLMTLRPKRTSKIPVKIR